jgi:16S rRNA processing protein RimM
MATDLILIGAVAGAFGVRGEVRLKSFTGMAEDLFEFSPFLGEDGRTVLTVASWRSIGDGFAAYCEEVATREEAEALKSTRLYTLRERLPLLEDEEYYHADLIGLAVVGLDGAPLGEVKAVHDFGSGDLLEIWRTPGVRDSWYLPFTIACAPHVDLSGRRVIVDPPLGYMPEAASD